MSAIAGRCAGCAALVGMLLSGCGGGGGGGGNTTPTPTQYTMSLSSATVTVSAALGAAAPTGTVNVLVSPAVASGTEIYIAAQETTNGIASVTGAQNGTEFVVTIAFDSPTTLGVGTYDDKVTLQACLDQACTQQIGGSPQTVSTQYTVTAAPPPPPTLNTISPSSALAGQAGFTLTATGTSFTAQTVLQWNGVALPTSFVNADQLTASVTAANVANAGSYQVTAMTPGGVSSNALVFTVAAAAQLQLSSISPTTVAAGGQPFVLTVLGQGFTTGSVVQWNGSARSTQYVSTTELLAQISMADIAAVASVPITVMNSAPAGTSNAQTLTVAAPSRDAVAFQENAAHSGVMQFNSVSFPASSAWSVTLGGAPSYALIAGGKVFVTVAVSGNTQLVALDQTTGATVWGPIQIAGPSNAAYDSGMVFALSGATGNGAIMQAYDAATGNLKWSAALPGQLDFSSAPSAADGYVYTVGAESGGTLYAVNETNGNVDWTQGVANGDDSTPAVTADGVYTSFPCQTNAFRPATGESIWYANTGCDGGGGGTPVVANGVVYSPNGFGSYNGTTYNAETGALIGSYVADNPPALGATTGYFLQSQTLRALTLSNNTILWSFAGDGALVSSPVAINQYVLVGSSNGNLYALDGATGAQVWTVNLGAAIPAGPGWGAGIPLSGLAVGDGLLIVPAGNTLTAYVLSTSP